MSTYREKVNERKEKKETSGHITIFDCICALFFVVFVFPNIVSWLCGQGYSSKVRKKDKKELERMINDKIPGQDFELISCSKNMNRTPWRDLAFESKNQPGQIISAHVKIGMLGMDKESFEILDKQISEE